MMKPVLEATPEGEWVIDPNPEITGCALAKVMSYNDAHTEAVRLGYPSLTEALEHLDELRENSAASGVSVGDRVVHVPTGARGVITANVEGWWRVEFIDGSHAVVRPSNLTRIERQSQ